jgi:hypothetical protein
MRRQQDKPSIKTAITARRERLMELAALLTADGYPCSHETVAKDLDAVRKQMAEDTKRDASEWIGEQLRDLDALYADLWPNRDDPRVTAQLMKIMERRAKLLGLDSVQRVEVSGPNGNPVAIDLDIDPILRALSDRATGQD